MSEIAVGDLVIRKSHGGDIVFKVTGVADGGASLQYTLKGLHLRLLADAPLDDLERVDAEHLKQEIIRNEAMHNDSMRRVMLRRSQDDEHRELVRAGQGKKYAFFDVPGRVLHIDGDEDYLKMCLKTYGQLNIQAEGRYIEEDKQPANVMALLKEYRPDILVVTGHDALVGGGKKNYRDINNYRTSKYFVESVRMAREYQPSLDGLVVFAGACQSYFEAILEAGANFASSPTRIFIHAYDPVFIAEKVAFTSIGKTVDVNDAIAASVTGAEGVGGLETRGKFRIGMPKSPY